MSIYLHVPTTRISEQNECMNEWTHTECHERENLQPAPHPHVSWVSHTQKCTANVYSVDVPIQWYQVDTDAFFLSFLLTTSLNKALVRCNTSICDSEFYRQKEPWRKRNDAKFTNHEVASWIEEGARVRRVVSGQVVSQESKGSRPSFQQQTSYRELGSGWSPKKQQLEEGQHAEVCLTLSSTAGLNYIYLTCFTLRSNQQQGQEANFKLVVEYISCHLCFKFVIIHLFKNK